MGFSAYALFSGKKYWRDGSGILYVVNKRNGARDRLMDHLGLEGEDYNVCDVGQHIDNRVFARAKIKVVNLDSLD